MPTPVSTPQAQAHPVLTGGRRCRRLLREVALLWLSSLTMAVAQPPDPAEVANRELLRQQQRDAALHQRLARKPAASGAEKAPTPAPDRLPVSETPCFRIKRIALTGDSADRFQWALAAADIPGDPAIGRCLGTLGINLIIKRVQNALIGQGFITARVRVEPQDLNTGLLTLTLVPGRIRAIRFAEGSGRRANHRTALPAAPGDLLNLRDIEQALENFKRVPTAESDIQIVPAEGTDAKPGESDLVIAWQQAFPLRLSLSADDSGAEATGQYQGGVTLSLDHPLGLNDLFYLSVNEDLDDKPAEHGTRGHSLHYSLPFGYWLLGLTTNDHDYRQSVAGTNQTYLYSGESENAELELSRLIQRDAARKTKVSLTGWTRASKNYIDDTEVEVQRRRMAGWELGLEQQRFFGAATLDTSLAYRHGTGAMGSLPAPEESFGEGTSRPRFLTAKAQLKLPFHLGRLRLNYGGELRAQWNDTPLVPQDRFSLGGRFSIRGFDGENLLTGDRGWLIRNDLGLPLGGSGQEFYLGLDHGEVGGPSSQTLAGTRLSGAVIGLRGSYKGFSYDLFLGQPIDKPQGFQTPDSVTGFNLNWTF